MEPVLSCVMNREARKNSALLCLEKYQSANGFSTQPGVLGERFLGESSQNAVLPKQVPKGAWVWVRHRLLQESFNLLSSPSPAEQPA